METSARGGVMEADMRSLWLLMTGSAGRVQFGSITTCVLNRRSNFASELERMRAQFRVDVLYSLERVWSCGRLSAGDGVHRACLSAEKVRTAPETICPKSEFQASGSVTPGTIAFFQWQHKRVDFWLANGQRRNRQSFMVIRQTRSTCSQRVPLKNSGSARASRKSRAPN